MPVSAGARELEAPRGASERPLPGSPERPLSRPLHPLQGLIVVFGGRPQSNCEAPCLIFKRK